MERQSDKSDQFTGPAKVDGDSLIAPSVEGGSDAVADTPGDGVKLDDYLIQLRALFILED